MRRPGTAMTRPDLAARVHVPGRSRVGGRIDRLLTPRSPGRAYAEAAGIVLLATGLRWSVGSFAAVMVPFVFYFPAVAWAGLIGGPGPAAIATVLSAVLAIVFFMPAGQPPVDVSVNVALFAGAATLLAVIAAALRTSRIARLEIETLYAISQDAGLDGLIIYEAVRDAEGQAIDLRRIAMNAEAERMVGPARQLLGRRYLESSPTLARDHLFARYVGVLETGIPAEDEFLLEAGRRWIYNLATRVGPERIAVAFRDVTATRATIDRQKFLMRELNHRVKNALASVLSVARQTSTAGSAVEYRDALTARITAMARAHDLLMTESWEGALLADIVAQTLAPYDRICAEGPSVAVASDVALAINMALHELATNAVKYGALSVADGHVTVRWQMVEPDAPAVEMHWRERGGPAVAPPTREGFGTRLLTRGFATTNRSVDLDFAPDGLACRFRFDCLAPGEDGPARERG